MFCLAELTLVAMRFFFLFMISQKTMDERMIAKLSDGLQEENWRAALAIQVGHLKERRFFSSNDTNVGSHSIETLCWTIENLEKIDGNVRNGE